MPKSLPLPIIAGGRLITTPSTSLETIGGADFAGVVNMFRDGDQMARLPGWVKFKPNPAADVTSQYTYDDTESILAQEELVRGDGTRVLVAASLTKIKYYSTATNSWVQIGSGYSPLGIPWQIEAMASYVLFNNAVDLPQWWAIGEPVVQPIHELREQGIASAGRMSTYNGFLFFGDIVEIRTTALPLWMNGYVNYTLVGTSAKNADFNVLASESRTNYAITTGPSTVTATLPVLTVADFGKYYWFQKVDNGPGAVVTSPVLKPLINLTLQGQSALLQWNGKEWGMKVFADGLVAPHDPYGIPSADITEHIADEYAWGELGNPINWAPLLNGLIPAAGTTIILPFKPHNWTANLTRVGVMGAGPDQGILGGQSEYPNGIMITGFGAFDPALGGVPMTLEVNTDPDIVYPRLGGVTRWTDINSFVGKQRIGNGQRITVMAELNGVHIIYQELGIWIVRWTAQAKAPFALKQKYSGLAVPMFGDCLGYIRNAHHVYPSLEGMFVQFDGLTDPIVLPICEMARDVFFAGLLPTDRCFTVVNALLQMIWFVRPNKMFAYRYRSDSPSCNEIDATIGSGTMVKHPGGTNNWFVLSIGRFVYQFAMTNDTVSSFHRDGFNPYPKLTSGLNGFKAAPYEKMLHSLTPLLATPIENTRMTVQVRSTYNPNGVLLDLLNPIETLPNPDGHNFVALAFQANFFQDEIIMTDDRDIDFRISGRLFEFDVIPSLAVTRTVP